MKGTVLVDLEGVSHNCNIVIHHVGARDDNLRIVLSLQGESTPRYVIDLIGVRSHIHLPGKPVPVLVGTGEVGSFGWWLEDHGNYRQLQVSPKDGTGHRVIAIARQISYRPCDDDDLDANFPG